MRRPGCGASRAVLRAKGRAGFKLTGMRRAIALASGLLLTVAATRADEAKVPAPPAFDLVIEAPPPEQALLRDNLSLQRYRALSDMDEAELERLMRLAEREARSLLGTRGFFQPDIGLRLDTGQRPPRVLLQVAPGPVTRVRDVRIEFTGDIASSPDPQVRLQRDGLRREWSLSPGQPFTQAGWDLAKAQALRRLQARRYPRARIESSLADIDAPAHRAHLGLRLDSGPRIRLGPRRVTGLARHEAVVAERFARLQTGSDYDEQVLLDAQQRLVTSGYFDSAFIQIDPEGDPTAVPVDIAVREAPLQRVVTGLGLSTDQGPRASLEHRHLQMPGLGWRADSRLEWQTRTSTAQTEWTSIPDARGWRSGFLARAERLTDDAQVTHTRRLRLGRLRSEDRIDRHVYLQWDDASVRESANASARDLGDGAAIAVHYDWTGRRFDRLPDAREGRALGLELGLGTTLTGTALPFQRSRLRGLWLQPLEGSRLQWRAEAGAVLAPRQARVPSGELFRTGGDTTVRGYRLREIGVALPGGGTAPGRYLAVGSVEWLRPLRAGDTPGAWEQALFLDTGAVAERPARLRLASSVGLGVRYASPVGPLRADLAWAFKPRRLRLHLTVGLVF